MIHLFLFDVDGVMVEARGYLKALQDTVAHFSRQMGLGDHPPTEEEVRTFEANGLTNEWDSGAMCVAALLLERLCREPSLSLPPRWPDGLSMLAAHPHPISHPDYAALAREVGERLSVKDPEGEEGVSPARAASLVLWSRAQVIPGLGHSKSAVAVLLGTLLSHTHDFYRAPVTRHFQHLVLGSRGVAETYGVSPDFEGFSYLRQYDRPLLSPTTCAQLQESVASGRVRAALYTARPSLPPVEADGPATGYPPEAEMARSLVGLEEWPLIGLGRMRWLAWQTGEDVERLVKPSPVQALAAIGAAWSGQEVAALEAALALHGDGELRPLLADLGPVTLDVFEDTIGGLKAVERGLKALEAASATATWRPYGVTSTDGPKAAAMAALGVPTYPSVNEAVLAALMLI